MIERVSAHRSDKRCSGRVPHSLPGCKLHQDAALYSLNSDSSLRDHQMRSSTRTDPEGVLVVTRVTVRQMLDADARRTQ